MTKFTKGDKIQNAHVPGETYEVVGCGYKLVHFVDRMKDKHTAHVSNMVKVCDDKYCSVHNQSN